MYPIAKNVLVAGLAALSLASCQKSEDQESAPATDSTAAALKEADILLAEAARQTGVTIDALAKSQDPARFNAKQNVFFPGTVAIDFATKQVTLPLYQGLGPSGSPVYYILTDASDFGVAKRLRLNYAPKLANGRDTEGSQHATIVNGQLKFEGNVDFSPVRSVTAGAFPNTFPPAQAQPGAVGDANYSPVVVLPSGTVVNASIVANSTGTHDHLVSMDKAKGTVVFELLDGFQGGQEYYYHIVTESSDLGAATIERGTYTPRLAKLPAFGQDLLTDKSALLGFSPVSNGETGKDNPQRQGLNSTILDGPADDPINVFPLDPDNAKRTDNTYSPMWDAHINAWTREAIAAGQRRRITSLEDLTQLVKQGYVSNAAGNSGTPNALVAGLKPSNAIINCSVMAQPQL